MVTFIISLVSAINMSITSYILTIMSSSHNILFVMLAATILNIYFTLTNVAPIILLVFTAFEATLGLSLLVMVSNTYGTDYMQNLNLHQWWSLLFQLY